MPSVYNLPRRRDEQVASATSCGSWRGLTWGWNISRSGPSRAPGPPTWVRLSPSVNSLAGRRLTPPGEGQKGISPGLLGPSWAHLTRAGPTCLFSCLFWGLLRAEVGSHSPCILERDWLWMWLCTPKNYLSFGKCQTLHEAVHICFCLVAKLCLTLCNPMDCSMPGFPVLHHLLKFAQIHAHSVNDAI